MLCFEVVDDDVDDDDDGIVDECDVECPSEGWELCIEFSGLLDVEGFGDGD